MQSDGKRMNRLLHYNIYIYIYINTFIRFTFNPKKAGGSIWSPPVVFAKMYLINIIISNIFPENFIEIPQAGQKI